MPLRNTRTLLFALLALALAAPSPAAADPLRILGPIQRVQDRAEFNRALRALGYKHRGGIDKARTDRDDGRTRTFPHFTASFQYQGQTFPFTMAGRPPASGRSTSIRTVIVPLRMNFVYFEEDRSFDPSKAVDNIVRSPIFNDARFPDGFGQYGDMLQRATFWNKMDPGRRWHVTLERPRVTSTIDVQIEPDIGELIQVGDTEDTILGNLRFGAMDMVIHNILQFVDLQPDEVPIFVTYNVFADALGYHDAFVVGQRDGTDVLQTLIYTSWLEGDVVGDLLADVSTLNHEVAEWYNDPYVNNIVPTWLYPPSNSVCSFNPFLEVGDPQGNGPEYFLFPTVPVPLNGFTYHLQDVVMLPWFTGEAPSSAFRGWYDFPDGAQVTTPFKPCAF